MSKCEKCGIRWNAKPANRTMCNGCEMNEIEIEPVEGLPDDRIFVSSVSNPKDFPKVVDVDLLQRKLDKAMEEIEAISEYRNAKDETIAWAFIEDAKDCIKEIEAME